MKKNIEHIIKESLENHELPYNSEAWSAMSAKLDAGAAGSGSSVDSAIKSSLENNVYPYNPQAWDAMNARLDANAGSGVDQAIKSSLDNYELPYAAGAWTALNAKLDAKSTPKSNTKWYVAASVLIAAATVSYFVINGSTEESNPQTSKTEIAQNDNPGETTNNTVSTSGQSNTTNNSSTSSNSIDENALNNNTNQNSNPNGNENPANNFFGGNGSGNGEIGNGNGNTPDPNANKGGENGNGEEIANNPDPNLTPAMEDFVMPNISSVCQGTSIRIANTNKYDVTIIYPNGATWTGKRESETTLRTSAAGLYKVGYMLNGQMMEEGSFTVKAAPSADFEFVDLGEIILEGLPTTEVVTNTPGIKYEWKYGKETATGSEATPHFFTKGNHDIELTVTGSNGCQSNVIKTVSVDETYNLLATNAFDPRSLDSRNNTFIPRALVEREDVKFTMIIVDKDDGHVMYETSDASQGWDGVDRATGEQLDYQKTFIWKVTIENPVSGERPVYGGSAVIIPRQN